MTNQLFCYWLQGYFEISNEASLTEQKILLVRSSLNAINEPLGVFTQWLQQVISYLESQQFRQSIMDLFIPEIKNRLNAVFFHVIDTSYERKVSLDDARKIHEGTA